MTRPANDVGLSEADLHRLAELLAPLLAARLAPFIAANSNGEPLLTKDQLAARWGVGVSTIGRMVKAGMPVERVTDDAPRFDLAACDVWRRTRPPAAPRTEPAKAPADVVSMEGVREVVPRGRRCRAS